MERGKDRDKLKERYGLVALSDALEGGFDSCEENFERILNRITDLGEELALRNERLERVEQKIDALAKQFDELKTAVVELPACGFKSFFGGR